MVRIKLGLKEHKNKDWQKGAQRVYQEWGIKARKEDFCQWI